MNRIPDGSLAAINEVDALDPCNGHSNPELQYHYHLTPICIDGANDTSICLAMGYMDDGFPLYGECEDYTRDRTYMTSTVRGGVSMKQMQ